MFYKKYLSILIFFLLTNCTPHTLNNNNKINVLKDNYSNKGFALIFNDDLYIKNIITKKIDKRSLIIFQKNLKKNTQVKITNILNGKSLIATVGINANYPLFNNSVISLRIAETLDINIDEPYIKIVEISQNSSFLAKKAKTYEEEKKVAAKVPVNNISISDLNNVKKSNKIIPKRNFKYKIKIADFYFYKTALLMVKRIKDETKNKNTKIEKISDKKYRVYIGPFYNINSLQKSYNDINILEFENIEIINND